jgi:uncharacterized protein (TIGR03435 family)
MMTRTIRLFLIFIHAAAYAQTKSPLPEFDAAVVKLNKSAAVEPSGGIPGGEFSVRNISMIDLLQFAYKVDGSAISGFQPWFRSDRFDVIAKGPVNTSDATLRLMLQSRLAREFKLKVHEERKPQDAFALVVASGGPKLQRAANPAPATSGAVNSQFDDPVDPCKRTTDSAGIHADCTNICMEALAKRLTSLAPAYLDRPVVDPTGLTGTYDLKLQWTGKGKIDAEGGLTIFDAVTKQLGLKLEQRKVPLPGIAIDHVERLAEN